MFKEEMYLGSLKLSNNIFYAPLAGCTDYAFRQMAFMYKPGLMFCEMVKMEALVRLEPTTFCYLDKPSYMHPLGAQICGSNVKLAKECAKIVEDLGFDVVDLNCGCPVDKVTKDGSGSALLKTPERIGEILCEMVAGVKIPVTVKIRIGWHEDIVAEKIVEIAEQAGAKLITIHGRTRKQGYRGKANWDVIGECKKRANKILVFGNGDVIDGESAERIFLQTGCDGVCIGRGILGKPWIVEDIRSHFSKKGQEYRKDEREEKESGHDREEEKRALEALLQHISYIQESVVGKKVLLDMKRVSGWYIKGFRDAKEMRQKVFHAESPEEIQRHVLEFKEKNQTGTLI
jgi:nifR3 family TIM-barrel protein